MKSQEEIVERYLQRKDEDFFGFETHEYLKALEFVHAQPYLKPEATAKAWGEPVYKTDDDVLREIKDYIGFAYDKAHSERGISANRSIQHYIAWTWLIDEEFSQVLDNEYRSNYDHYGLPILNMICEHYNLEVPEY
jgi:hypothetical protein